MALLEWVRPDPKCNHGRTRGLCTKCNGCVAEGPIPSGTFRGKPGGRLVAKKKKPTKS
jgi:hypothetical protein